MQTNLAVCVSWTVSCILILTTDQGETVSPDEKNPGRQFRTYGKWGVTPIDPDYNPFIHKASRVVSFSVPSET